MLTFDTVLADPLIAAVRRDDTRGVFQVRLGVLRTAISLQTMVDADTGYVRCVPSHILVSPLQHRTKQPGLGLRTTPTFSPAYALHKVVDAMVREYREAVAAGHVPEESWLVAP